MQFEIIMRLLIFVCLAITCTFAKRFSYEGYKTYRVTPTTKEQVTTLKTLENGGSLDFWTSVRAINKPVDVMVEPKLQKSFNDVLKQNNFKYEVLIENVERQFEIERFVQELTPKKIGGRINLYQFHSHAEMNAYLDQLASEHPDIVSVETIGQSYEKRDMKVIKISTGGNGNKPAIFIDGGIHAREWAAPAEALCIISALVEDSNNRAMIENVDWYILPLVNPDGYEYTNVKERLWRKTRSVGKILNCNGADANRNFDFHWMEVGADDFECSDIYGGRSAFSEIESLNVANFMKNNKNIQLYLTFHSYGEYILYPWGYTSAYPANRRELDMLGRNAGKAISALYGTIYEVGSSTNTLYPAAGGSDDYAKGVVGIPLAYTIELPAGGRNGFDLPPTELEQVCKETFEGIKVFHKHIEDNYS